MVTSAFFLFCLCITPAQFPPAPRSWLIPAHLHQSGSSWHPPMDVGGEHTRGTVFNRWVKGSQQEVVKHPGLASWAAIPTPGPDGRALELVGPVPWRGLDKSAGPKKRNPVHSFPVGEPGESIFLPTSSYFDSLLVLQCLNESQRAREPIAAEWPGTPGEGCWRPVGSALPSQFWWSSINPWEWTVCLPCCFQ